MNKLLVSDPDKADVLLILDLHNLAWRSYFSKMPELPDSTGYPTYHYRVALSKIAKLVDYIVATENPKRICIVSSADEYIVKKRKLLPEYKAQREKDLRELEIAKGLETETILFDPVRDIKKLISFIPHCKVTIPSKDEETDDVIAAMTAKYKNKVVYVNTSDRDSWQIKSKRVRIVYQEYPEIRIVGKQELLKKFYHRDAKMIPLIKTLIGDASDNITGVYRFPRKVIAKLDSSLAKENPRKALRYIAELSGKNVKERMEKDMERLLKVYKVVKLRRNLKIAEYKKAGDLEAFLKFLKKTKIQAPKLLSLWVEGLQKVKPTYN